MKKLFSPDSAFVQIVMDTGTLIWINLLWLLCCIPVFTIGASTAAMYRMVFNVIEHKSTHTADFFRAFKSNFKQGTMIWLLILFAAVCLYLFYAVIAFYEARVVQLILLAVFLCFLLLAALVALYAFPLTCYFENTLRGTLSNALIFALANPVRSVAALALTLLPLGALLFMTQFFLTLLVLFVMVIPSVLAFMVARMIRPVFLPYTEQETHEE